MNQKESSYSLQITKNIYRTILYALQDSMINQYGLPFFIDWNFAYDACFTQYSSKTKLATGVIIQPYGYCPGPGDELISDNNFLLMVNSFFHEARHVEQSRMAVMGHTELDCDMACALIAENHNDDFYIQDNYNELANEADAQIYSLLNEQMFLKTEAFMSSTRRNDIDRAMTVFVNRCLDKNKCCLKLLCQTGFYQNWNTIVKDINESPNGNSKSAYETIQTTRKHSASTYDLLRFGQMSDDLIVPVLIQRPDLITVLDNASTMRDECKIMTSIMCTVFPTWQDKFKSLDKVDLSMKTVCGTEFTNQDTSAIDAVRIRLRLMEEGNSGKSMNQIRLIEEWLSMKNNDEEEMEYD